MSTPDASQFTQFRRYTTISGDAIGSVGSKISPFNTSYSIPILPARSQALFLPSANKEQKFARLPYTGPITLDSPVTNPIVPTGGYHLFTFVPDETGWYRIFINNFGDNDMDLFVGLGNVELDIPAIVAYDLDDNYDTPPEDIQVFSASGSNSDYITSLFQAGRTYQVLVIGYDGNGGGTYTLTVQDNIISMGNNNSLISSFYYVGNYQLYRFIAPQNNTYDLSLNFDDNNSDIFISQANTPLDIQGCIDYINEEGSLPESVIESQVGGGSPKTFFPTLTAGSTYEVLVYTTVASSPFRTYEIIVNYD